MFIKDYSIVVFGSIFSVCIVLSNRANAMTVSGPIAANVVTASGDLTVSSMSVTTLTVTSQLIGPAVNLETTGKVLQVKISSITSNDFLTSSTSFVQVSVGMIQSIALSSSTNYVEISMTGSLSIEVAGCPGYLTIYRDTTTNLGDPTAGLAMVGGGPGAQSNVPIYAPVGLSLMDKPGNTASHTYSVYMRVACDNALFPTTGFGELVLEEIEQ
jgi:hypothetical protein